jgi:hypothetical protein
VSTKIKTLPRKNARAFLAGGSALIVCRMQAWHSTSSDFARFSTDSPAEKPSWLLLGGIVGAGAGGLTRRPRSL